MKTHGINWLNGHKDQDGNPMIPETWNPVSGCSPVSEGCDNCYASTMGHRMKANPRSVRHGKDFKEVMFHPERLAKPLGWKKPRVIFVNSMSDLFHESVTFEQIAAVFGIMAATPEHRYIVLTKRPERMLKFFKWAKDLTPGDPCWRLVKFTIDFLGIKKSPQVLWDIRSADENAEVQSDWPLPNLWLGVSAENQEQADKRIPILLDLKAMGHISKAILSFEPMLGAMDVSNWLSPQQPNFNVDTWDDVIWPSWIPQKIRDEIIDFHSSDCRRSPKSYLQGLKDPYNDGPLFGSFGVYRGIGGSKTFNGRYIPMWNNIGRVVLDDGSIEYSSSCFAAPNPFLDWAIVGGETGSNARPMSPDWVRAIRDQCKETATPFYFKGWGEWLPDVQRNFARDKQPWGIVHESGKFRLVLKDGKQIDKPTWKDNEEGTSKVGKKIAGHLLDRVEHLEIPG